MAKTHTRREGTPDAGYRGAPARGVVMASLRREFERAARILVARLGRSAARGLILDILREVAPEPPQPAH